MNIIVIQINKFQYLSFLKKTISKNDNEKKCNIPKSIICSLIKVYVNIVINRAINQRKIAYLRYFLHTLFQCFFSDNRNESAEIIIKSNHQILQNIFQKISEKLKYEIEKMFKRE
jgi:hypothetical protein